VATDKLSRATERVERSLTITGPITAQIVRRNNPGTMNSTNPIAMARPARRPATSSGRMAGETRTKTSWTVESNDPSRASCTA
jgi:hypothetical protein